MGIVRVDSDSGEDDACFAVDLLFNFARERIQVGDSHGVGEFHVHGGEFLFRTVIVNDEVVCAVDAFFAADEALDLLGEFVVIFLAEQVAHGVLQHFKARFDDENGNQNADVGFERESCENEDECRGENGKGEDGVKERVGTGGDERTGIYAFSLRFHVTTEDNFYDHCDGDDNQRNGGVVGIFGVDDFFDRFHARGDARVNHDGGDDHGGQVFNATVTERVLFVGQFSRELVTDNRDDGRERVREVVHGVENDGNGISHEADNRLDARENDVGDNPDNASSDDDLIAVFFVVLFFIAVLCHMILLLIFLWIIALL